MLTPDQQQMFVNYQSRYQRRIFAYILTLAPDWNDAEEILQNTSIVLWKKFADFTPGTSFFAWATAVAKYEVLKYRERQAKESQLLGDELLNLLAVETGAMDDVLENQRESLQGCVAKLRSQDQLLIRMRYFRGASSNTIATSLGRSVESVCNSLSRIRGQLLKCVQRSQ